MSTVRAKILIVEDDANLSRITALRLKAEGYDVVVARDAYQAVKLARQEKPALVIMDVRMPAGDGFHVHENLNEYSDFLSPVIYLTGWASPEDEARARQLGAVGYIHKPFTFDVLISAVRAHVKTSVPAVQEQ